MSGQNTTNIIPQLLTTKQAAALCSVGERTMWRWSHSGIAPAPLKIAGSAVRFKRAEIIEWIDAGCPRLFQEGDPW